MSFLKDETIIQNIKDCGQSLIDNAEKILNDYKYRQGNISITCYVDEHDKAPYIRIEEEFIPENVIKRFEDGSYDF